VTVMGHEPGRRLPGRHGPGERGTVAIAAGDADRATLAAAPRSHAMNDAP
jgi:hypothetical protein